MRPSTKSQHVPQLLKPQDEDPSNQINNTKTQSPEVPNLKLPAKGKQEKVNAMSLSRKIYIDTDHEDQIVQSVPTAKHTFMSEQVEMNGEKFDGFYTSRNKDQKQQQKENQREKFRIEPDMKSDFNNSKGSGKTKGQRSRFYYKAEDYDSLDQVQVEPKEKSVRAPSVKPECVKPESLKPQSMKPESVKQSVHQVPKEKSVKYDVLNKEKSLTPKKWMKDEKETPKSNTKNLSNYISKINKSESPYIPPDEEEETCVSPYIKNVQLRDMIEPQEQNEYPGQPRSSRFSQQCSSSPLQQSHQKLFNKCYKETYSHLKLMLRQIHESQEQVHIIHKEITDTLFEVIKERAEAIRKEMNDFVDNIVTQWMKDQWEFVKTSEIEFMDDVLEIQNQLNQREKDIHNFLHKLLKENKKQEQQNEGQEIFHTFNAKGNIRSSMKSAKNETTWKKVTTDLLMFNYESNIIEIQEMIEKISSNSLQKCNKAVDMLPSSGLFAANSHAQILNPKAKKQFKQAVLRFMNEGTLPNTGLSNLKKSPTSQKGQSGPKSKGPSSKEFQEYGRIVQQVRAQQEKSPKRQGKQERGEEYYGEEQEMLARAYLQESDRRRRQKQGGKSPKKLHLDKTYYASGRGISYS